MKFALGDSDFDFYEDSNRKSSASEKSEGVNSDYDSKVGAFKPKSYYDKILESIEKKFTFEENVLVLKNSGKFYGMEFCHFCKNWDFCYGSYENYTPILTK